MGKENSTKLQREPTVQKSYLPIIPQTRAGSAKYVKNSQDSTPGRQTIQLKMVKRLEETILQGGYTEGPETYERILNITNHWRNGN